MTSARTLRIALVALPAVALIACGSGAAKPVGTITIVSPVPGAEVPAGQPVLIDARVDGIQMAPLSATVNRPGEGHLHTYVDGQLALMTGAGDRDQVTFTPGPHTVRLEVTDNSHQPFSPPVEKSIQVIAR